MPTDLGGTPTSLRIELAECLSEIELFGLNWRGTRFHSYLRTIAEDLEQPTGLIIPRKSSAASPMPRLWEAVTQSRQLVHTRRIWPLLTPDALKSKLKSIISGPTQTPPSGDSDPSRNTLLELVTAWLLHEQGMRVNITESGADVTASMSSMLPTFAVECKRPSRSKTLRKNLLALRRQLDRRYGSEGFAHGIAVVGIDRVLDLSDSPPGRDSFTLLERDVHETLRKTCGSLQQMAFTVGFSPKTTPIGAVALLGGAFTLNPFGISTFHRLGFFNLAPIGDERVVALSTLKSSPRKS